MNVTLTRVSRKTTDKEGKPLIGGNGRPYTRLSIQTKEHASKWLSGFDGKETSSWREGDTVEIDVEENGQYLNFSVPKSSHQVNKMGGEDMVKLHAKLDAIWTKLGVIQGLIQPKVEEPRREFDTTDEREADIKPEDMPW